MGQKIPVEIFGTWSLTDVGEEEKDGFRRETDSGSERLSGWWQEDLRCRGIGTGCKLPGRGEWPVVPALLQTWPSPGLHLT